MTADILEQVRSVKQSYVNGIDNGNYELLMDVFADTVYVDVSESLYDPETNTTHLSIPKSGYCHGANLAESMTQLSKIARTKHTIYDPTITELFTDKVYITWPMTDRVEYFHPDNISSFEGTGYYYETYILINGQWKIASIQLKRTSLTVNY